MNYEYTRRLTNLGKKIPREWLKKGIKSVDVMKDKRERLEQKLKEGKRDKIHPLFREKFDRKEEKVIRNLIASKSYNYKKEEVDQNYHKKIDRAWDEIIKTARARGDIPSAKDAAVEYKKFMESRKR